MLKEKGNIVISLGDDGAIATCFKGSVLVKRHFLTSPFSPELNELSNLHPDFPIYLILDTIDQNYAFSNLPALKSSNLMKMVKRKIQNEFDPNDYNSYLFLGKDAKSVRKDLKYVFLSIRNSSPLSEWLDVIYELPNKFAGIHTYPVESENFLEKLKTHFLDNKEEKSSDWDIFVSHNRVGGFRQVVFRDGKIIFTRISQAASAQSPDAIGVNISQEIVNTLEYIRRIGFSDNSLDVFVVSSKESFQFIEIPGIKADDMHQITPFDVAQKLALKDAALEGDKFGDVVFAANFSKNKKTLKILPDRFKVIDNLNLAKSVIKNFLLFLIFLIPLLIIYYAYSTYISFSEISSKDSSVNKYKSQISQLKSFEDQYGINPDMLVSVTEVDQKLTKRDSFFKKTLQKFTSIVNGRALVETYNYNVDNDNFTFSSRVKLMLSDVNDYGDLIIYVKEFTKNIEDEFKGADVSFTNLPSETNIKFDSAMSIEREKERPISITIKGRVKN